ncbi:MAG: helix-turn-helix domain-containing protein [Thermoleophilaceae bacterium]|nr:helix-turn-helix domain-containing protein [Thermoleophilaceae bacterium]
MAETSNSSADMIDVRGAAALVRRHPETVRRWVWSGRLAARRQGNRLLMVRADVEAIAASEGRALTSLAAWVDRARAVREAAEATVSGSSAAEFVIEDRAQRSRPAEARAGR